MDLEAVPLTFNECLTHKKPFISFCFTHDTALCSQCSSNNHQECKTIDYDLEFQLMYSNFSFEKLFEDCKSFCKHAIETLDKIKHIITSLNNEHNTINKIKVAAFFEKTLELTNFVEFCKGKLIEPEIFLKAMIRKYLILFEEKYNEIFKLMGDLQRELKLLEANYQNILKLLEKGQNASSKTLYEQMSEVNISSKKIVKNVSYEFKLKKIPIDKALDFQIIQIIIKDHILEIMQN